MYFDQSRSLSLVFVAYVMCAFALGLGSFQSVISPSTEVPTPDDNDDDVGVERPRKLDEYKTSSSTKSGAVNTTTTSTTTVKTITTVTNRAQVVHYSEKSAETMTATEASMKPIKMTTEASTKAVKAASMDGWGVTKNITWLYILVALLALILIVLLVICLCLLCRQLKGPYEPKICSAEIDIIKCGTAKPMFVDEQGKAFTVEGTPKSISSPISFQL